MAGQLPGTLLDDLPKIVWEGLDSPDQLAVIWRGVDSAEISALGVSAGAMLPAGTVADWVGTELAPGGGGLRSPLYLTAVPQDAPFDIVVCAPADAEIDITVYDKEIVYRHGVSVKAGVDQTVLRLAKGGSGWILSPSYASGVADNGRGDGSEDSARLAPTLTELDRRLRSVPEAVRGEVETLLGAIPVLLNAVKKVQLVVDVSASMAAVLASTALEQFAHLGWTLAMAAGNVSKSTVTVGEALESVEIDKSVDEADWVRALRQQVASGMATGSPTAEAKASEPTADSTVTVYLTDDPPVLAHSLASRSDGGPLAVIVVDRQPDLARKLDPARWDLPAGGRYAQIGWDGEAPLVDAICATAPPFGELRSGQG